VAVVLVAVLLVPLAFLMLRQPASARGELRDRWNARAANAATFVGAWLEDVAAKERTQAERVLAGPEVTAADFQNLAAFFAFDGAVLLDGDGRLLQVHPSRPELVGADITPEYAHLRRAVDGEVGVSGVVPSASQRIPVIAVATPFKSAAGRRVISGAYEVGESPIGAYLTSASSLRGNQYWLVDEAGSVVASSAAVRPGAQDLDTVDPSLARAVSTAPTGAEYDDGGERRYFGRSAVKGSPWEVVASVPTEALYSPVNGVTALNWVILAVLALASGATIAMVVRLTRSEREFAAVSLADGLTGLSNRRALEGQMERVLSHARRHKQPLAVLMVDIDNFKRVNDTLGHEAGDIVLRAVADRLSAAVRAEDMAGRWGGEEFLVLLPLTTPDGAAVVGERIRATVRVPVIIGGRAQLPTVSVGVAGLQVDDDADTLLARADAALYEAKLSGRDRVVIHAYPAEVTGRLQEARVGVES
jgi:diguanylate cyclase (GGDEF)-like protein